MVFEDLCNTGLSLGLGSHHVHTPDQDRLQSQYPIKKKLSLKFDQTFPSLTLAVLSDETKVNPRHGEAHAILHRQASSASGVSLYSNSSVKKEREASGEELETEVEKVSFKVLIDDQEEDGSPRKKLRLTKEQSNILEDSFKEHSTLNPKQKQALANQLNLRPRQVEVWFQNRRARTKLKQTEAEYELLKKCCETLTEENRRLQKELQEMKALKLKTPFYMQLPAATLTMCPSCERIGSAGGSENGPNRNHFSIGAKPEFYNPITHQSAAC